MTAYVAILIDRCIASRGPFPRHLVGVATGRCVSAAAARCKVASWCFQQHSSHQKVCNCRRKHRGFLHGNGRLCSLMRRRLWRKWWQQRPHAGGRKTVQWTIGRERVGGGGEGGRRNEAVRIFTRCGQAADDMTRRGGAEGAGRGEREADDSPRGGRGWTTRGKRAADDTTRGSSSRRQKMADTRIHGGQAAGDLTRGARRAGSGRHDKMGEGSDDARQVGGGQHNKKVVVAAAEDGGTRPCGCPPTSKRRWRR
jgi:hypothetical protein